MMAGRKFLLIFILSLIARRGSGQGIIGATFPCEDLIPNPNPNDNTDNLSCPNTDQSVLVCYPRSELCNDVQFCAGGSDEGRDLVALDCKSID